jgi:predicted transcriptional regulator
MTNEQIAIIANALSNPIRLLILQKLANESCCYHGDLSDELPIANSTLSQHLKVLKKANLIQGEINPPKIKYCINQDQWQKAKMAFNSFFETEVQIDCCD